MATQRNSYDVDESGVIYEIQNKSQKKQMKKKAKQKKRGQRAKRNKFLRRYDRYPTLYYFNKFIDILGNEFYLFLNGVSINHLFSTNLRNWGKTIPSIASNPKRWDIFEKDVLTRMHRLLHHYRKLYSYYHRSNFDNPKRRKYDYKRTYDRLVRQPYSAPLLLFAVYDLTDATNRKVFRKLNFTNAYNVTFDQKKLENIHTCLYTKVTIYLYLNAPFPVSEFSHHLPRDRLLAPFNRNESSLGLLPSTDAPETESFIEYENTVSNLKAKRQMLNSDTQLSIAPYVLKQREKVLMAEQTQLKMWSDNYTRIHDMNTQFAKLRVNKPIVRRKKSYKRITKLNVISSKEDWEKEEIKKLLVDPIREQKENEREMNLKINLNSSPISVRYYVDDGRGEEKELRQPSVRRRGRRGRRGQRSVTEKKMGFDLVIIQRWSDVYKYCPEWKRFNKQLRAYFCPNLLRMTRLFMFLIPNKASLFAWTYNNRVLVFQALRTDVTRDC